VHVLNIGGDTYDREILSTRHFISCIMVNLCINSCHFASIYGVNFNDFIGVGGQMCMF